MDEIDEAILRRLQLDGRLSMRKLASLVHLSPPAVAERVRRMEEHGIITGYTVRVDREKLATQLTAFIHVFMKSSRHGDFLLFAQERDEVREWHRIASDACYLLRVEVSDRAELDRFLDQLLAHGNYRMNLAITSTTKE